MMATHKPDAVAMRTSSETKAIFIIKLLAD